MPAHKVTEQQKREPHPDHPGFYHREMIAQVLNLKPERIAKLISDGHIDVNSPVRGYYPLIDTVNQYCKYAQTFMKGRRPEDKNDSVDQIAQQRLRKLKLENDIAEGQMVSLGMVKRLATEATIQLAASLDGAAGKIAGGDPRLRKRLLNEHRRIRKTFSKRLANIAGSFGDGESDTTAA